MIAEDINQDIFDCYITIQSQVDELIEELSKISKGLPDDLEKRKPFYYRMRDEWNKGR